MRYRKRTGNCLGFQCYKENPILIRWAMRQRHQYTLMMEAQPSAMTEERVKILEETGLVWDSQAALWEERLEELKAFRKTTVHTSFAISHALMPHHHHPRIIVDGLPRLTLISWLSGTYVFK
jgi:hypothetical protein